MNFMERSALKVVWFFLRKKMPALKRWAPVIGSVVLIVNVILRGIGYTEAADVLGAIGKVLDLTVGAVVSAEELAAISVLVGIALKVKSETDKARGPIVTVVNLVKRLRG